MCFLVTDKPQKRTAARSEPAAFTSCRSGGERRTNSDKTSLPEPACERGFFTSIGKGREQSGEGGECIRN